MSSMIIIISTEFPKDDKAVMKMYQYQCHQSHAPIKMPRRTGNVSLMVGPDMPQGLTLTVQRNVSMSNAVTFNE